MKFLHTADWHLGRLFHQVHLTADQAVVLDQIVEIAIREKVDVVIVAGDIYDRTVPPPEAVALLESTLEKLVWEAHIPVVLIPGNHDHSGRLGFLSRLLSPAGLHVVANLDASIRPIQIGEIDIFAIPYVDPAEVRIWSGNDSIKDHADAMSACIDRMRPSFSSGRGRMLVAHGFVAGMKARESERPLTVGGTGNIPKEVFEDFSYVALGHLHAPQAVSGICLYSGSPIKYSFSEIDDAKAVVIGEFNSDAEPKIITVPLVPRRNVRAIEGLLNDLIAAAPQDSKRDDYLRVILTDDGALLNAMGRIREVYPNALQIERRFLQEASKPTEAYSKRKNASESELFRSFFKEVVGTEPTRAEFTIFTDILEELEREQKAENK